MKVLHVTSRWGAGVQTVVEQYASATPEFEHYALHGVDPYFVRGLASPFVDEIALNESKYSAVRQLRTLVRDMDISVVHAHASVAGALVRLSGLRCRVVYSPHAYAGLAERFSRPWFAGQAERLLGLVPIVIGATGVYEANLAAKYSRRSQVCRLVNLPYAGITMRAHHRGDRSVVIMTGRICAQKDPAFFGDVADLAMTERLPVQFVWLGDGDPASKARLEASNVEVTGWLSIGEMHKRMAEAQVYLHTARYEGSCLSILDAAAIGLPAIGRSVPGVSEIPWMLHANSPSDALASIRSLCDKSAWQASQNRVDKNSAHLNVDEQRKSLRVAYGY